MSQAEMLYQQQQAQQRAQQQRMYQAQQEQARAQQQAALLRQAQQQALYEQQLRAAVRSAPPAPLRAELAGLCTCWRQVGGRAPTPLLAVSQPQQSERAGGYATPQNGKPALSSKEQKKAAEKRQKELENQKKAQMKELERRRKLAAQGRPRSASQVRARIEGVEYHNPMHNSCREQVVPVCRAQPNASSWRTPGRAACAPGVVRVSPIDHGYWRVWQRSPA